MKKKTIVYIVAGVILFWGTISFLYFKNVQGQKAKYKNLERNNSYNELKIEELEERLETLEDEKKDLQNRIEIIEENLGLEEKEILNFPKGKGYKINKKEDKNR